MKKLLKEILKKNWQPLQILSFRKNVIGHCDIHFSCSMIPRNIDASYSDTLYNSDNPYL